MHDFVHDDLDIQWSVTRTIEPSDKKDTMNPTRRRLLGKTPPYDKFHTCHALSRLEEDLPLILLESPTIAFTGKIRARGETAPKGWQAGWMQTIHSFPREADYGTANARKLFLRIHPVPVRDVTTSQDAWPFSDDPREIAAGTVTVDSSDEPFVYLPAVHPQNARDTLNRVEGVFSAVTVLACYRPVDHMLVVLGGFAWTVDYGCAVSGFVRRLTPNGNGIAVTEKVDKPQAFAQIDKRAQMTIWKSTVLSLSKDDAFDRMEESFDGVGWNTHIDHTDDEGRPIVSWIPA